jgi:hypothetical protein
MDGNNSLKQVLQREHLFNYVEDQNGDVHLVHTSNEIPDQHEVGGDYYIPRLDVAKWTSLPRIQSGTMKSQVA